MIRKVLPHEVLNTDIVSTANNINQQDLHSLSWLNKLSMVLMAIFEVFRHPIKNRAPLLNNIINSYSLQSDDYIISIGQGCVGSCSYCAIKAAKGSIRSKPLEEIKKEFKRGVELGYKKIWLAGDDVGCWGEDIDSSIVDLLNELLSISGEYVLIINYFDPTYLVKYFSQLLPLFKDRRLININFPIQSGSQTILNLMKRKYDVDAFIQCLHHIRKINPHLVLKTHLLVGFPSETYKDFLKTIATIRFFDLVFVNSFTPRPNTPAASYKPQVPKIFKMIRYYYAQVVVLKHHSKIVLSALLQILGLKK